MNIAALRRYVSIVAILAAVSVAVAPALAAERPEEIAAQTALHEMDRQIDGGVLQQDLIAIIDQVQAKYPDTDAAKWAEFRRAQDLLYMGKHDEAISTAGKLIAENKDTMLACWAQWCLGESMVGKGEIAQGITELLKVEGMLPSRSDLGPLCAAESSLGRVCCENLKGKTKSVPRDAAEFMGMDKSNAKSAGGSVAIVAAYRAIQGKTENAYRLLDKFAAKYPSESATQQWAAARIAESTLVTDARYSGRAASILASVMESVQAGDQQGAKAALWLAEYYEKKGDLPQAVATLQTAKQKFLDTRSAGQLLYKLGTLLERQGQIAESMAAMKQVVEVDPELGYAAPALYNIGTHSQVNRTDAVAALTKLASGPYDERWRGMAYWKLGELNAPDNKAEAKSCYDNAIQLLTKCQAEQANDLVKGLGSMLQAAVDQIKAQASALGVGK